MAVGNTRPLEPTNVVWPRPSAQARSAVAGNASITGVSHGAADPYRPRNGTQAKSVLVGYDYERGGSVELSDAIRERVSGTRASA